ncbi:MAG: thioredoxin family protein [Planctomycetaceae bacterium]|nr:thioredoxin family protein [Planctomycetaceae bacterium]
MNCRIWTFVAWVGLAVSTNLWAQTREEKIRGDKQKVEAEGFWIYNDLATAFAEGKRTGKPILVVLRCIPCEECVKLDDDLLDQDESVRPLLEQFVCVRQVSTNGLDLSLFQFDTDQSWAMFLLNADGTIYGRFGTRSHSTQWDGDVSLAGLAETLRGALELHRNYPNNVSRLVGKRGPALEFGAPEEYPSLSGRFTNSLDYSGRVVDSCIHCHQIGDAQRELYLARGKPIPEEVLFPYPHPKSIGLILDSKTRSKVQRVEKGSIAERGGFLPGDSIETMAGQGILSMADIQWVLHGVPASGGQVPVEVQRDGGAERLTLELPTEWRRGGDLSWRASSWGLRRIATGGLVLKPLDANARRAGEFAEQQMALRVDYVGEYGAHAAGKQAGFQQHDILIEVDGQRSLMTEGAVFHYLTTNKKVGDQFVVVVRRGREDLRLTLPIQE